MSDMQPTNRKTNRYDCRSLIYDDEMDKGRKNVEKYLKINS